MGANPVPGYNAVTFLADETTYGTAVAPANTAAFAAQAIATIQANTGKVQAPIVRAKQDRGLARDMQDGFVSGRYEAPTWNIMTSLKTRADADDAPRELALWKACGFTRTVNSGVSYVLSPSNTPIESSDFVGQTLTRILGRSPGEMELERLLGCFVQSVKLEGGDKEVTATFSGMAQTKQVGTSLPSITLADGIGTSLTFTAAESYALATGYYICESEVILVTAPTGGATSCTIARAQFGTSGVAHSAQPLYPYLPSGISYGGTPISEALTTSFTFDSVTVPVLSWVVDIKTGLEPGPGETGSANPFQVLKANRLDVSINASLLLKGNDVRLFNKARARTNGSVAIVQGTTAGGIITIGASNSEIIAPEAQDNANDSIVVPISLRVRGSGAATPDSFAITLS